MSNEHTDDSQSIDPRTERALTEYLTVLDDVGRARGAADLYLVVSQSGKEYLVDTRTNTCECPDSTHRGAHCKHLRRVAFATGERAVPGAIDGIDEQLGEHVAGSPKVATADGGIIKAGDDGEILDDGSDRPDECDCADWNTDVDLPCWPCYRDGFDQPPNVEE